MSFESVSMISELVPDHLRAASRGDGRAIFWNRGVSEWRRTGSYYGIRAAFHDNRLAEPETDEQRLHIARAIMGDARISARGWIHGDDGTSWGANAEGPAWVRYEDGDHNRAPGGPRTFIAALRWVAGHVHAAAEPETELVTDPEWGIHDF